MTDYKVKKEKDITLQILRGLAIVVVLIHHAISKAGGDAVLKAADEIIICFHMPVFFIISGFLYQKKIEKYQEEGKIKFIADKMRHLLLPYVFWTVLLWGGVQAVCSAGGSILEKMAEMGFEPMSVGSLIFGLFTYESYYTEHLWFLYVLFLYFVTHTILGRWGSKKAMLPIAVIMGLIPAGVVIPDIIGRYLIWFVFFCFGRILGRQPEKLNVLSLKNNVGKAVLFVCFIMSCVIWLYIQQAGTGETGIVFKIIRQLVKYIIGFEGSWLLFTAAEMVSSCKGRVSKIIKSIGDYSFDIYLMHNPYIVAFSAAILSGIIGINAYIVVIIAVAAGVILPIAASWLVIRRFKVLAAVMLGR